ncbi:cytochrome P450 [Rippkaea orientalis PCC 8801]|uniref:Cytochrome P450 n=1 Tax=Rippkaea orientalis (strain PCC 8801 / RF-1) TaxID=41431 RepID=B7K2Q4_RIPO1|nr:cytochrome P450 [Rippkaea orientalis]ACK66447.1 cytochrome P450 [Rippkaea orientalis PCC 8801]
MFKGLKIALQADTGRWFTRCNNCQQTIGNNPDTVTVHVEGSVSEHPYAQFEVVDVGNGKIALKADTGKYVGRCNGCIVGGAYPDFLTIHVDDPSMPWAQFTPERLANGKYAFKADTGKYFGRCNGCSPTSAYPDTVAVHVDNPHNSPWAQWTVSYVPFSYLERYDAIPADNVAEKAKLVGRAMATDSRNFFKELRANRPIFITPKFVLVTLFPDVQEVFSRPEVFSVRLYAPKMDPNHGPAMLSRDNTVYNWREKSIMKTMLDWEDLPRIKQAAGEVAKAALDKFAPTKKIETVNELAKWVLVRMSGDYYGFPGPDRETMYRWSSATQSGMLRNLANDPQIHEASVQAGKEMRDYLTQLLQQKKANNTPSTAPKDIFTRLVQANLTSDIPFDESRILTNMALLLISTLDTTAQAIVQSLEQLLRRPDILPKAVAAAKANDDVTFAKYVWEALRFNPVSPALPRFCESDYTVAAGTSRATRIPANSLVLVSLGSAMMDGAIVQNPEQFSIERPKHNYMHYGYGDHTCLGEHIGNVVVSEVIKQVLLRPGVRLIPGDEGKLQAQPNAILKSFVIAYDG